MFHFGSGKSQGKNVVGCREYFIRNNFNWKKDYQFIYQEWTTLCLKENVSLPKHAVAELQYRIKRATAGKNKAKLDFKDGHLDDKRISLLVEVLKKRFVIARIDLRGNDISEKGATAIIDLLKEQCKIARTFDVQKRKGILFIEEVMLNPSLPADVLENIKLLCGILIYSNAVCFIHKVYADNGSPYFIDDKTLWKIWSEVVGKPTKAAIAKACAFANYIENSTLVYPDLEHILLEALKMNRAVPVLNVWQQEQLLQKDSDVADDNLVAAVVKDKSDTESDEPPEAARMSLSAKQNNRISMSSDFRMSEYRPSDYSLESDLAAENECLEDVSEENEAFANEEKRTGQTPEGVIEGIAMQEPFFDDVEHKQDNVDEGELDESLIYSPERGVKNYNPSTGFGDGPSTTVVDLFSSKLEIDDKVTDNVASPSDILSANDAVSVSQSKEEDSAHLDIASSDIEAETIEFSIHSTDYPTAELPQQHITCGSNSIEISNTNEPQTSHDLDNAPQSDHIPLDLPIVTSDVDDSGLGFVQGSDTPLKIDESSRTYDSENIKPELESKSEHTSITPTNSPSPPRSKVRRKTLKHVDEVETAEMARFAFEVPVETQNPVAEATTFNEEIDDFSVTGDNADDSSDPLCYSKTAESNTVGESSTIINKVPSSEAPARHGSVLSIFAPVTELWEDKKYKNGDVDTSTVFTESSPTSIKNGNTSDDNATVTSTNVKALISNLSMKSNRSNSTTRINSTSGDFHNSVEKVDSIERASSTTKKRTNRSILQPEALTSTPSKDANSPKSSVTPLNRRFSINTNLDCEGSAERKQKVESDWQSVSTDSNADISSKFIDSRSEKDTPTNLITIGGDLNSYYDEFQQKFIHHSSGNTPLTPMAKSNDTHQSSAKKSLVPFAASFNGHPSHNTTALLSPSIADTFQAKKHEDAVHYDPSVHELNPRNLTEDIGSSDSKCGGSEDNANEQNLKKIKTTFTHPVTPPAELCQPNSRNKKKLDPIITEDVDTISNKKEIEVEVAEVPSPTAQKSTTPKLRKGKLSPKKLQALLNGGGFNAVDPAVGSPGPPESCIEPDGTVRRYDAVVSTIRPTNILKKRHHGSAGQVQAKRMIQDSRSSLESPNGSNMVDSEPFVANELVPVVEGTAASGSSSDVVVDLLRYEDIYTDDTKTEVTISPMLKSIRKDEDSKNDNGQTVNEEETLECGNSNDIDNLSNKENAELTESRLESQNLNNVLDGLVVGSNPLLAGFKKFLARNKTGRANSPHHKNFGGNNERSARDILFEEAAEKRKRQKNSESGDSRRPSINSYDEAKVAKESGDEVSDSEHTAKPTIAEKSKFVNAPKTNNRSTNTYLDLSNENISNCVDFSQFLDVSEFKSLKILLLRNNELDSVDELCFGEQFLSLTDLDLAYNFITSPVSSYSFPKSLLRLDLSHNKLVETSCIMVCINLLELNLSHNRIKAITGFPSKLRRLDVSYNRISSSLSLRLLSLSAELKTLNLANNPVLNKDSQWRLKLRSFLPKLVIIDETVINKALMLKMREEEERAKIKKPVINKEVQKNKDLERVSRYQKQMDHRKIEASKLDKEAKIVANPHKPMHPEEVHVLTDRLTRLSPSKMKSKNNPTVDSGSKWNPLKPLRGDQHSVNNPSSQYSKEAPRTQSVKKNLPTAPASSHPSTVYRQLFSQKTPKVYSPMRQQFSGSDVNHQVQEEPEMIISNNPVVFAMENPESNNISSFPDFSTGKLRKVRNDEFKYNIREDDDHFLPPQSVSISSSSSGGKSVGGRGLAPEALAVNPLHEKIKLFNKSIANKLDTKTAANELDVPVVAKLQEPDVKSSNLMPSKVPSVITEALGPLPPAKTPLEIHQQSIVSKREARTKRFLQYDDRKIVRDNNELSLNDFSDIPTPTSSSKSLSTYPSNDVDDKTKDYLVKTPAPLQLLPRTEDEVPKIIKKIPVVINMESIPVSSISAANQSHEIKEVGEVVMRPLEQEGLSSSGNVDKVGNGVVAAEVNRIKRSLSANSLVAKPKNAAESTAVDPAANRLNMDSLSLKLKQIEEMTRNSPSILAGSFFVTNRKSRSKSVSLIHDNNNYQEVPSITPQGAVENTDSPKRTSPIALSDRKSSPFSTMVPKSPSHSLPINLISTSTAATETVVSPSARKKSLSVIPDEVQSSLISERQKDMNWKPINSSDATHQVPLSHSISNTSAANNSQIANVVEVSASSTIRVDDKLSIQTQPVEKSPVKEVIPLVSRSESCDDAGVAKMSVKERLMARMNKKKETQSGV